MFIQTVDEAEASGILKDIYDADRQAHGYVPNYTQAMSLHPEVIAAWRQLSKAVRSRVRLRHYELVTYAAALALGCHY